MGHVEADRLVKELFGESYYAVLLEEGNEKRYCVKRAIIRSKSYKMGNSWLGKKDYSCYSRMIKLGSGDSWEEAIEDAKRIFLEKEMLSR